MKIDTAVLPVDLLPAIRRMWEVSGAKIVSIDRTMDRSKGAPVLSQLHERHHHSPQDLSRLMSPTRQ
jgi:hypothetical protein